MRTISQRSKGAVYQVHRTFDYESPKMEAQPKLLNPLDRRILFEVSPDTGFDTPEGPLRLSTHNPGYGLWRDADDPFKGVYHLPVMKP